MKYITSAESCQAVCVKNITHFSASRNRRGRSAYGRRSRGVFSARLSFVHARGRRVQEAAPYRCHGPKTGGHMGQYKSLSGECRRGRSQTGPCSGRPQGSPLRVHLSNGRAADSRPYGGFAKQLRAVRRGRRALQPSTSRHLIGKARRSGGTAPVPIFHKARAQWPGRNRKQPLRFCAPEMTHSPSGTRPP